MLERIALNQTRLHTPGLSLDGKGVALGTKGLVLLPSIDRLVAWLAVYTRERSLEDVLPSLDIHTVKSKLGTREIAMSIAAESSDRMDRVAETTRLVGGFCFTGTSRHFVQYRDAGAPFGYDVRELLSTDAHYAIYHDKFTQVYDQDQPIGLRALLLRLMPHVDPSTHDESGPRVILAEPGLGPALIHYFVRSRVEAEVGVAEWQSESEFDDGPTRRYLFRLSDLPKRMRQLLHYTPGITVYSPAGPGAAVEVGYRHPVALRACPVFEKEGLVFLRGRNEAPLVIEKLPAFGDVRMFARVELRTTEATETALATAAKPANVRVAMRVVPSSSAWKGVTAALLSPSDLQLLRKIVYALPPATIREAKIAVTSHGTFIRCESGIEALPLGAFYVQIHPQIFIPAGTEVSPAVNPEVLARALEIPAGMSLFVDHNARAIAVEERAFAQLETYILEAHNWEPAQAEQIEALLAQSPIDLRADPLPVLPMVGYAPHEGGAR
jgi:hypothetical protein